MGGGRSVHDRRLLGGARPLLFEPGASFADHANLAAYFERLMARPSFKRAVDEARPYRRFLSIEWPAEYA
jgi:glutathione S-transferase